MRMEPITLAKIKLHTITVFVVCGMVPWAVGETGIHVILLLPA